MKNDNGAIKESKTSLDGLERIEKFYNFKNKDNFEYKIKNGISKEIVEEISKRKNEPQWMLDLRLKALETYYKLEMPTWGPDLSELDLNNISTYVKPKSDVQSKWEDVPDDIKNTFERLGIPKAEHQYLAGVGAQYDSEVVYHRIKNEMKERGIIYTDIDSAIREYPELVKEYFSKCVPLTEHKFIALHYAVFSGGSFVYVPKGVNLEMPLSSYYRLNSPESGQFEHTLIIVDEGASLHFIEGCSAPKYSKINLHAGCVELFV
ncbi:MAG TPA: Fe-S cluster assembly protein SufB, partial [Clostridiales bacterium]|nr:Fe-S cluster assembly protein SufB [Clostridiales bacterium]